MDSLILRLDLEAPTLRESYRKLFPQEERYKRIRTTTYVNIDQYMQIPLVKHLDIDKLDK